MAKVYELFGKVVKEMPRVSVFNVANYFLSLTDYDSERIITHLKLQKLCYYAKAWHLAFTGRCLFPQQFQAWVHGPVCVALWHQYKQYSYGPIPKPDTFDISAFKKEELETLEAVWEAYGQFDAKYLEDLTHQEDPWITARKGCFPGESCSNEISPDSMKAYYSKMLEDYGQ
jgi:Uncharacterized phage-associated protein